MSKYFKAAVKSLRTPLCEGRGIQVFRLDEGNRPEEQNGLLSRDHIEKLKKEYGKINKVDPSQPTYKKLISFLDSLTPKQLKQLADEKIKFVSSLARNRVYMVGGSAEGKINR